MALSVGISISDLIEALKRKLINSQIGQLIFAHFLDSYSLVAGLILQIVE